MAVTRLRAATQIRRWFRRSDGRILLTLNMQVGGIGGTPVRGLTEVTKHQLWRENQIEGLDGHPGELSRDAAFEVWGLKVDAPDDILYTTDLTQPPPRSWR